MMEEWDWEGSGTEALVMDAHAPGVWQSNLREREGDCRQVRRYFELEPFGGWEIVTVPVFFSSAN